MKHASFFKDLSDAEKEGAGFPFNQSDPDFEATRTTIFGTSFAILLLVVFRSIPTSLRAYLNILGIFLTVYLSLAINQHNTTIVLADYMLQLLGICMAAAGLGAILPRNFKSLLAYLGILRTFRNDESGKLDMSTMSFVKCATCHKCYTYAECVAHDDGRGPPKIKVCTNQHHPGKGACNTPLLVVQKTAKGKWILRPSGRDYLFPGLIKQLPNLLSRPDIQDVFWHHCTWITVPGWLRDIYDGTVWRAYCLLDNPFCPPFKRFAQGVFDCGLTLNLDGFQAFRKTHYSVTAIYMVVNNLPRNIRYLPENIILVAIIPGPHEPDVDHFHYVMEPLVDELKKLYEGVRMQINGTQRFVFAVLLLVSCDAPALRKMLGFAGHTSGHGCTKCNFVFQREKKYRAGEFDLNRMTPRTQDGGHNCAQITHTAHGLSFFPLFPPAVL